MHRDTGVRRVRDRERQSFKSLVHSSECFLLSGMRYMKAKKKGLNLDLPCGWQESRSLSHDLLQPGVQETGIRSRTRPQVQAHCNTACPSNTSTAASTISPNLVNSNVITCHCYFSLGDRLYCSLLIISILIFLTTRLQTSVLILCSSWRHTCLWM